MRTYFFFLFWITKPASECMNERKKRKEKNGKKERLYEHGFARAWHFVRVSCDSELNK